MKYPGYFTKSELDKRGWAKKMYDDFLPVPHKKIPNPVNPDWAPMGLYNRKIVEEIESRPGFQGYSDWTNNKFRPKMREVAAERKARKAAQAAAKVEGGDARLS